MSTSVQVIPATSLMLAFIPVAVVIAILYRWSLGSRTAVYSVVRMLVQLLLIGYVLVFVFDSNRAYIVIMVLAVMLFAASWIAIRPVRHKQPSLYFMVVASLAIGGLSTLLLITQSVLTLEPWFEPRYMVPIGGMIFANAMNTVSLAAERFESERDNGVAYVEARRIALQAAMIPVINSFFAVGLVALPGMMTGQILSGVSPLIAARYQIVVMCMVFGSAGISAACYLVLAGKGAARADENEGGMPE